MADFTIDKKKAKTPDTIVSMYTYSGMDDFKDEDGFPMLELQEDLTFNELMGIIDGYAIKLEKGEHSSYYVKRGESGKLFNPVGLFSEGTAGNHLSHMGKRKWQFETVSKRVFNFYIKFLQTKNLAWLNNAQREL